MREETFEEMLEREYPAFIDIRRLGVGAAFGDIALREETTRTASIICSKNSTFAVLTKKYY